MKEIELACESFKKVLEEQLNRIANSSSEKVDFSTKETVTIENGCLVYHPTEDFKAVAVHLS